MSNLIELKQAVSHFREIVFEEVNPQWQSSTWEMCREFWPCDIMLLNSERLEFLAYCITNLNRLNPSWRSAMQQTSGDILIWAVNEGHLTLVKSLAEAGVDLNYQNHWLESAMMRACSKGRHEILAYLIKCGADPLLKDVGGQIALMLSAGAGESKCVEQALTVEGLNARDNWLETAAMKASRYGHKECLYHIVSAGADLTLQNSDGENVFDICLARGYFECLEILN